MSIFKLTDITFNKNPTTRPNDAQSNLVGSRYNSNTFRFPIDLGSYDKGHYMVIHINEQNKTSYKGVTGFGDEPSIITNRRNLNASIGGTGIGGLDSVLTTIANVTESATKYASELVSGTKNAQSAIGTITDVASKFGSTTVSDAKSYNSLAGVRTIKRTTDTIALYMPDTLNFTHQQGYNDISLGGGLFAAAGAAASAVKGSLTAKEITDNLLQNASPFVANAISRAFGDTGAAVFSGVFGFGVNPQLEVLYVSPQLRTFRFDFMFYPRSTREATEVQRILDRLRFHQAPELLGRENTGGVGGFFLVPPSEFDIKFYYNGKENPNIPKISTCVLTNLDIDYAPNGFATYELPNESSPLKGRTGMPVAIRLSLEFKETEMLTKANFSRDAGRNSVSEQSTLDWQP